MGTAFAKDGDDQLADLGAKVTAATPSVAVFRTWPQDRSGTSESSTAPPSQQLELPMLEPEITTSTEGNAMSPRVANYSAFICATDCEAAHALAEATVETGKDEHPCWGSADCFSLLCSGSGEETEITKEQCLFQFCRDPSGSGIRWTVPQEVVECDDIEGSLALGVPQSLTPRERLALDIVPQSSGNGRGHVQQMTLTNKSLESNRGIKNQQHKKAASQMHLAAVSNHQRAEIEAWAASRVERSRANSKASGGDSSPSPPNGSPRRLKAGWGLVSLLKYDWRSSTALQQQCQQQQ